MVRMTNNNYSEIELKYFSYIAEHAVSDAVEKEKIEKESTMEISVKRKSMYAGFI